MDKTDTPNDKMDTGNNKKRVRQRKMNLYGNIRKQMEFYFSTANLQKDRFLKQLVMSEPNGFVDVDTFLNFNKIKTLTTDVTFILKAIKDSELLMVDESGKRIGRKVKYEEPQDTDDRTVYAEFLPKDVTIDWLINHFSQAGKVVHVSLPKFKSTGDHKGFAFVEFETADGASKACELLNCPRKNASKPGIFAKTCKTGRHMMNPIQQEAMETDVPAVKEEVKKKETEEQVVPKLESEEASDFSSKMSEDVKCEAEDLQASVEKSKKRRKASEPIESLPPLKVPKFETSETNQESTPKKNKSKNEDGSNTEKHKSDTPVKAEGMDLSETEKTPKKKHGKKKGSKAKVEPSTGGLRVISKQEWLAYRQEYYQKHKQNMSELKAKIKEVKLNHFDKKPVKMETETKHHESKEAVAEETVAESKEEGLLFLPNVIIKVTLAEPVSKKFLKEQMLEKGKVAFLDMVEGDLMAHARCADADSAKTLLKDSTPECQYALLGGDEEKNYWDKIFSDREKRLNSKTKKKFRGSDKVMAKADRVLKTVKEKAIHMVFED